MAKSMNLPLRVAAYNRQFKTEAAKIYLKEGADPTDPTSYTSQLYERYVNEGTLLEKENGLYCFHKGLGGIGSLNLRALNFLQVLAYLEYYESWRLAKVQAITDLLKKRNEEAEKVKAEKLEKEKEATSKPLEFEERNGVTYLKGTSNFVISKIC